MVDQRCFNGGHNTSSPVWVTGSNGKRYKVQSKEDAKRERLRRRSANAARRVEYERRLGNLSPQWREWVKVRAEKVRARDGQTELRPSFVLAKLIRQAQRAEQAQSRLAASRAAMERSADVLEMAFFRKDFAPLVVSTASPQHRSNLTKFTMEHTTIQTTALMHYYKFLLHPSAQLLARPKTAAEKKAAEVVFVSERTIRRWKTDFESNGNRTLKYTRVHPQ